MAEPTPIGGDWVAAVDPGSGETYYANPVTGETSWEYPAELGETPQGETAQADDDGQPQVLETRGDWVKAYDAANNVTYFVNMATNASQLEVPNEWDPPATSTETGGASATAEQAVDGLSEDVCRQYWKQLIDSVKEKAEKNILERASKFSKISDFATVAEQKKAEVDSKRSAIRSRKEEEEQLRSRSLQQFNQLETEKLDFTFKTMDEYAEEYLNLNRKGMFGKRTTVEKILSWKGDTIKTSLRKMPAKELENSAIQCFRNITGYMGDRQTRKEDGGHAEKLLKMCLNAPEELRDEVYCQLVKQVSSNPSEESTLKGWQLFGLCSGGFPPSEDFLPFIMSFCHQHIIDAKTDPKIVEYAKYTLARVEKSVSLGPRKEIPSAAEIDACKHMDSVLLRVYHMDGSYDIIPATSWMTGADLNRMMVHLLDIKATEIFAVFELSPIPPKKGTPAGALPETEERMLEDDERILDLLAYWQRISEEEKQEDIKDPSQLNRLVFKTVLYIDPAPDDIYAHREQYFQATYDIVIGRYPCSEESIIELAALQQQVDFGDERPELDPSQWARYIPKRLLMEGPAQVTKLSEKIQEARDKHKGKTVSQAIFEYLQTVKDWKIYGSSFFSVIPQNVPDLPSPAFLAINPKAIVFLNPENREIVKEYPYSVVPTWGHSGTSFVLHVGDLVNQDKLYFTTDQGKDINDLIHNYVKHLCAI